MRVIWVCFLFVWYVRKKLVAQIYTVAVSLVVLEEHEELSCRVRCDTNNTRSEAGGS